MASQTNPYAAAHAEPQGEGDARPIAMQIIEDEGLAGKLTGKVMLITGSSSGIGIETVRALYATGADIYMQVRDVEKGGKVLQEVKSATRGTGKLELLKIDLAELQSVRDGVGEFLKREKHLNVLVNNAGVRHIPPSTTIDGFETVFATNHLAHFLLTSLLLPTLTASSTPDFNSRVINVSSAGALRCPVIASLTPHLLDTATYDLRAAYDLSKAANILHANALEARYGSQGVHTLSLHPGAIRTGMQRNDTAERMAEAVRRLGKMLKNPAQGAATTVWAAVGKVWEGKGGLYLEECREANVFEVGKWDGDVAKGGARAEWWDEKEMERLWVLSEKAVGLNKERE